MKKITWTTLGLAVVCSGVYFLARAGLSHYFPPTNTAAPARDAAESLPVYPREAVGLPITDIANLVVAVIPAQGFEGLGWDDMIDNSMVR